MLNLIDRHQYLFDEDISLNNNYIEKEVIKSSFLVLGGAGTIGQAVTKQIFKRSPKKLHVVDISENNLDKNLIWWEKEFGIDIYKKNNCQ